MEESLEMREFKRVCRARWAGMKFRCSNPKSHGFSYYSTRGFDKKWKEYSSFYDDMFADFVKHAKRYGISETTLDRIDNLKGYSKENCRWATKQQQQENIICSSTPEERANKRTAKNHLRYLQKHYQNEFGLLEMPV